MSIETNGIATVNDVLTNLCVSAMKYDQSDSVNKLINKQNNPFNNNVLYLAETIPSLPNAPVMPLFSTGPQTHYINGASITSGSRPNGVYTGFVKNNYVLKDNYALIADPNTYMNTLSTPTITINYSGVSESMLNTGGYLRSFSWMTFNVIPSGNLKCRFDLLLNPMCAVNNVLGYPDQSRFYSANLVNGKAYLTVLSSSGSIITQKQINIGTTNTIEWTSPNSSENTICVTLVPSTSGLSMYFRCTPTYTINNSYYLMAGFKYSASFYTNVLDYTDTKCIKYSDIYKRGSITLNWVLENTTNSSSKLDFLTVYYKNTGGEWKQWNTISLSSNSNYEKIPANSSISGSISLPLLNEILIDPGAVFKVECGWLGNDYDWYFAFNNNAYKYKHKSNYGTTDSVYIHPSSTTAASLLGGYFNGEESTGQVYGKVWLKHD